MEVQVNFAQDGANVEVRPGKDGRNFKVYSDGLTSWSDFRMPREAMSKPEANDYDVKYDFAGHVDSIGLTGWDFANGVSKWVGFDFDSIVGHIKAGLTPQQLAGVIEALKDIPWVSIYRSTSGNGLHVYVYLNDVKTANHTEHAALARAILGKMSALTATDLSGAVDVYGSILWIWSRRQKPERSFEVIKRGCSLPSSDVPLNWRDHLGVIKGSSRKSRLGIIDEKELTPLEELLGKYPRTALDDEHKGLMKYLQDKNHVWWWDADMHMLVTHTVHLKEAHINLGLRGIFDTTSSHSSEQNCFCFPTARGSWVVRRHSKGVKEHSFWETDTGGWTRCYLNRELTLKDAARIHGGMEHPKGGYFFQQAESALAAMTAIKMPFPLHAALSFREVRLYVNSKGKIVIEMPRLNSDNVVTAQGWIAEKNKFLIVLGEDRKDVVTNTETAVNYDDFIRHLTSESNEDAGWVIKPADSWRSEPIKHVSILLGSKGLDPSEITDVLGQCIGQAWKLVNKPFQSEYVGDRQWNRDAAKLRFPIDKTRNELHFPTWRSILDHCGAGLDAAVADNQWCKDNNVVTGGQFLTLWCASLFQYPDRPLPYLFFFGEQNTGKSTFHEALELLFDKGYCLAKQALTSPSAFNGELAGAVLCVVEEVDLSVASSLAYNRMKEWVTNKQILIHPKNKQPYQTANTTHWIQCANSAAYCPVFTGDSRIIVIETYPLDASKLMPRYEITELLEREASDFLTHLFSIDVPNSRDRLSLPAISSSQKEMLQANNDTLLDAFLSQECFDCPGHMVSFKDFYERFQAFLEPTDRHHWTKSLVSRRLPPKYPSGGVARFANAKYIGNVAFKGTIPLAKAGDGFEIRLVYMNGSLMEKKFITKGVTP
jgi:hypothetical protein